MEMLEIIDLKKHFGSKQVLDGVSFSVPEHSVFGFVGQNGAGKTTTMKSILGLVKADSGQIFVNGIPVKYGNTNSSKFIGHLPDVPEYYNYMTSREYLTFCGRLVGMKKTELRPRIEEMLKLVGLENEKHRIGGFSRGMKQRLGLAQALLHKPKLLICDEPTSALDPVGRRELMDALAAAKSETTIIFSTHILSDVEKICDQIAFLHQGKILLSGNMADIKKSQKNSREQDIIISLSDVDEDKLAEVREFLISKDITINNITEAEWNLENLFMEVIQK